MKNGSSQTLIHRLRRSPLSLENEGSLLDDGFCDFAYGSAQNNRLERIGGRVKVLISKKPTKNESGALCMGP